jgi:hypothetical protein
VGISIKVIEKEGVTRNSEPVKVGIPFSKGEVSYDHSWIILDEHEQLLPSQFRALSKYNDGSLRVLHGVFLMDIDPGKTRKLKVAVGKEASAYTLQEEKNGIFYVNTGNMTAQFNPKRELLSLSFRDTELLDKASGPSLILQVVLGPAGTSLRETAEGFYIVKELRNSKSLEENGGNVSRPINLSAQIKENGPIRAILISRGN